MADHSNSPHTSSLSVDGQDTVTKIVAALVARSCWFVVTPLPCDEWEIEVRKDQFKFLEELVPKLQSYFVVIVCDSDFPKDGKMTWHHVAAHSPENAQREAMRCRYHEASEQAKLDEVAEALLPVHITESGCGYECVVLRVDDMETVHFQQA